MQEEMVRRICRSTPRILGISKSNPTFPINCGDGWFLLLKKTLELMEQVDCPRSSKIVIEKIGNEWGSLKIRFRIDGEPSERLAYNMRIFADKAEEQSWKTCENCGGVATQTTRGSVMRLCDDCFRRGSNGSI